MRTLAEAVLTIDLTKIEDNARRVCAALPGVEVVGVTKVTCGSPEVARAMLAGGVSAIGESRLENIQRLRDAGVSTAYWLLRATPPDLASEVVRLADVSLESEIAALEALDAAAECAGRRHEVVGMVDVGDLREGMLPAEVPVFVECAEGLEHVDLIGLGTSLTCYGSVVPSQENLGLLASVAATAEMQLGRPLLVSGGSSTSISIVSSGQAPASIGNLRLGEAIVLGVDPATRERILDLHTDALVVAAPVIECRVKPSVPMGQLAQDAFGNRPTFEDRGQRRRAIVALGRQDVAPSALQPVDERIIVLGASSDHLILDVHELERPPAIGEAIEFVPGYAATLALFTSPYVRKAFTA